MQISLKLSRAQKHSKLILHIEFQPRMIFSSLFTGASDLPVFARTVLYKEKILDRRHADHFYMNVQ